MVSAMLGLPWSTSSHWHVICHRRWIQPGGQGPQGGGGGTYNPVGRDHKGVGTVSGPFGPILVYFGPLPAPGANRATWSEYVTHDGCGRGVWVPKGHWVDPLS